MGNPLPLLVAEILLIGPEDIAPLAQPGHGLLDIGWFGHIVAVHGHNHPALAWLSPALRASYTPPFWLLNQFDIDLRELQHQLVRQPRKWCRDCRR